MTVEPGTITVRWSQTGNGRRVRLTTWAVRQGRYGSIGAVEVDASDFRPPEDLAEMARVVLAALYGIDYDL